MSWRLFARMATALFRTGDTSKATLYLALPDCALSEYTPARVNVTVAIPAVMLTVAAPPEGAETVVHATLGSVEIAFPN